MLLWVPALAACDLLLNFSGFDSEYGQSKASDAGDVVDAEAGDDVDAEAGADVDLRTPCEMCIESPDQPGPGCATEVAGCGQEAPCEVVYQCFMQSGCFCLLAADAAGPCVISCVADAGITTPAETALMNLSGCVLQWCGDVCWPSDV